MSRKLHIIISGDEGRSRSLSVNVSTVRFTALLLTLVLTLLSLSAGFGIHSMLQSKDLHQSLKATRLELAILQDRERLMTHELATLRQEKAEAYRHEVAALRERSKQIEKILTQVGIDISDTRETAGLNADSGTNQGGPYYPVPEDEPEPLVDFAAEMIELANSVPLGEPARGWISSGYGTRTDPFNGRRAFHYGIDISNMTGTPIRATAAGKVVFAGVNGGYGKMVKIEHADSYLSIYGHLDHIQVKPGESVMRGDRIGTMGNTGRSSGSHLHYEVRHQDEPLNPYPLIYLSER